MNDTNSQESINLQANAGLDLRHHLLEMVTFEHVFRDDNHWAPREFWYVRACIGDVEGGWEQYGEQEQRIVPDAEKKAAELEAADGLVGSLLAIYLAAEARVAKDDTRETATGTVSDGGRRFDGYPEAGRTKWAGEADKDAEIARLREALGLAMLVWARLEPGDSRAVSDEFVACAAVEANLPDLSASMEIIAKAKPLFAAALSASPAPAEAPAQEDQNNG